MDAKGNPSSIVIKGSVHGRLIIEVKEIINNAAWKPAYHNNIPVKSKAMIRIQF